MRLIDRLRQMPGSEFVYLGCADSSSFIWIGKCAELKKGINDLNLELLDKILNVIKTRTIEIGYCQELIEMFHESGRTVMKNGASLDKTESKMTELTERREKFVRMLKDWKLIRDRRVIEEYPHEHMKPTGTTILIEGDLLGEFWTYSEVIEKKKEEERNGENVLHAGGSGTDSWDPSVKNPPVHAEWNA